MSRYICKLQLTVKAEFVRKFLSSLWCPSNAISFAIEFYLTFFSKLVRRMNKKVFFESYFVLKTVKRFSIYCWDYNNPTSISSDPLLVVMICLDLVTKSTEQSEKNFFVNETVKLSEVISRQFKPNIWKIVLITVYWSFYL
jgi:hypothetical protein